MATDYQIDVAMDAYAEASGQSVSRPWMEAAIEAFESAAQEPTDAECIAVLNAVTTPFGERVQNHEWAYAGIQRCREAMVSARRNEEKN